MDLQAWRALRSEGELAVLPSGLEIRVRRAGLLDLAERGDIPQTLRPKINEMMQGADGQTPRITLEQFAEYAQVINLVAAACIVAPAELDVSELDYADRMALFNWANDMETAGLQLFRGEQEGPVGTGSDGNPVLAATQFATGIADG